jgi:hydrogenase expression/formation protein HypD
MKYLTEFRNGEIAQRMAREIHSITTRPWKIMEVCGGQTHSIIRNGIDQMLPAGIEMIHGPGCPVCVTPLELIDKALAIAAQPGVIFCSFGDMLRAAMSGSSIRRSTQLNLPRRIPIARSSFSASALRPPRPPTP